jgi:ABC-2 type transport system permease protein
MMRSAKLLAVIRREYVTRVKTRGFWISTALIPAFMGVVTIVPSLMATRQQEHVTLGVADRTGTVIEPLRAEIDEYKSQPWRPMPVDLVPLRANADSADYAAMVLAGEIDAYVVIDSSDFSTGDVPYYARVTTNIIIQERLADVLGEVFTSQRLREAGLDPALVSELSTRVRVRAVGVGKEEKAAAGEVRFIIAYGMFFLLYMMLMLYGQQILRGVLEEKSSRIVEVVLSSLRPSELMVGKIVGIGGVGLTQLVVWVLAALAMSTAASAGILVALKSMPPLPIPLLLHFLAIFLLGFFVYASIFAVVGAMHSNEQEAQQYNTVAMMPIIVPVIFIFSVINAPNSTLAVVMSFIPLFSPLILLARVAVGAVPLWQLVVAYALLVGFVLVELYLAARIYRVGVLMYGKRPTLQELARWVRY